MTKAELIVAIQAQQQQDISDMSSDLDAQVAALQAKKSALLDRINANYANLISEVQSLSDAGSPDPLQAKIDAAKADLAKVEADLA